MYTVLIFYYVKMLQFYINVCGLHKMHLNYALQLSIKFFSYSFAQEIPCFYKKQKFHFRDRRSSLLDF